MGSPLDPLLRSNKHKESSALCGARARAPPLHPATFEKVDETFRRALRQKPAPAPPPSRAKMSNDNRGSSAHANGGAAEVKKAPFFGGSTPFLWASTKEMGSNGRTS